MTLLAVCVCGAEVESSSLRDGRCLECRADALCADDRAELVRLYRKRERLQAVGAATRANDEQAMRVRLRIIRRCGGLTPTPKDLIERQGRLARESAYGRLVVA